MLLIELPNDLVKMIREHAAAMFPHECCGFLLGRDAPEIRSVVEILRAENIRGDEEQHNRFTISPTDFMKAEKAARADQLDIVGFYHSHPNAPARPSEYDLEYAWPVYTYLIQSVQDGEAADMTCWVLRDDRSCFDEQPYQLAQ